MKDALNHDFTKHAYAIFLQKIWGLIPNEAPIPLTSVYSCHLVNPFLTTKNSDCYTAIRESILAER